MEALANVGRKRKKPDVRIYGGPAESIEYQIAGGLSLVDGLPAGVTLPTLPSHLPELIAERVTRMVAVLTNVDSLDLLGNLKQVDVTNLMSSPGESWTSVGETHAVTEVIALVLLGLGLPRVASAEARYAAEVVEELRTEAAWIVSAAQLSAIVEMETAADPLARVALRARAQGIAVRNAHYTEIGRSQNSSFLSRPRVREMMAAQLGFTGEDVSAVTRAVEEVQQNQIFGALDRARTLMATGNPPPDEVNAVRELLFVKPGKLFALEPAALAESVGIREERVCAVLDAFSVELVDSTPVELVSAYTRGESPFSSAGLLKLDPHTYFPLATAMLSEHVRRKIEVAFKGSTLWAAFDDQRKKWSEGRAKALVGALLGGRRPKLENFNYLVPDSEADADLLAANVPPPSQGVHQVEGDLLFIVDDVAFCVEVKAGTLSDRAWAGVTGPARRGLDGIIAKADEQAERLRSLILTHHGLWTARRTWVDLSGINEVHNMVVVLEDLGSVIQSMSALIEAGIVKSSRVPWIVSLHDLAVFRDLFEHPAQFLTYLRRRTQAEAARWLNAVDELDVMMLFLNGNLYFESDPSGDDEPPRAGDVARKRRYRKQGPVLVGTLTDPLDAWYESEQRAAKPARDEGEFTQRFLTWSREQEADGWLRVGADLVELGSAERSHLAREMSRVAKAAQGGASASFTLGGGDGSDRWLFLLAGDSPGRRVDVDAYLRVKKSQYRARRATAWVFGPSGEPTRYKHLNSPWSYDPTLAEEVGEAEVAGRIANISRSPASIPPSARRQQRRLRGKKKRA